jgi:hypothetical protein
MNLWQILSSSHKKCYLQRLNSHVELFTRGATLYYHILMQE